MKKRDQTRKLRKELPPPPPVLAGKQPPQPHRPPPPATHHLNEIQAKLEKQIAKIDDKTRKNPQLAKRRKKLKEDLAAVIKRLKIVQ